MSHTVGGSTTSYTWDAAAGLSVILQDSQGNTYVYGLDLISRTDSGGNQEYYLYDGLGSTTDLTDGSGNSTAGYGYDVFGAIRSQSGSSPNEFTFTGEQRDTRSCTSRVSVRRNMSNASRGQWYSVRAIGISPSRPGPL